MEGTMDDNALKSLPMDDFKTLLTSLKSQYDLAEQQHSDLQDKVHRQSKRSQRIQNENKQQIIQAETVNMMTKYQLVFVKMETIFNKVFNSNKNRGKLLQ